MGHFEYTVYAIFLSSITDHYVQTWRQLYNRKYITYRNAARGVPRTADIGSMHRPNKLVKIELVVPAICSRKDKHTDREIDTVIMILRLPIGGGVIILQTGIGNESVPIQLAQCWFPRLAISNAKI